MTKPRMATLAAVVPYAAWMAMMFALPATAGWYAARSAVVAAIMAGFYFFKGRIDLQFNRFSPLWGLLVGIVVCVLWIAPESFLTITNHEPPTANNLSPYEPAACGWALTIAKLVGSSFVIAPAEEIFFRGFLYRWLMNDRDWTAANPRRFDLSAFLWVVALFALEHNTRLVQGAMAGAFYGWLAIRKGLFSAIIAHSATNLLLALYVIITGSWNFW